VTVVHAVPDLTVDVYTNDALLLEDFAPGAIVGPVKLPSGTYELEITPADSETVALSGSATLVDGDDVSAVAHLTKKSIRRSPYSATKCVLLAMDALASPRATLLPPV
jgi:hypothetical protein